MIWRSLWAMPVSACALLWLVLAAMFNPRRSGWQLLAGRGTWALWVHGPLLAWCLQHYPAGRMRGISIGQVVLADAPASAADAALVAHELCHVQQAMRWGVLFPLAYVLSSVLMRLQGGQMYWDNAFERQARAAEALGLGGLRCVRGKVW